MTRILKGTTVHVVDETGGTFAFADKLDADKFANDEKSGGTENVVTGAYVTREDHDDWDSVAEEAVRYFEPPKSGFSVRVNGSYGDDDGSISLLRDGVEVVMWDSAEWIEDPSLVFVIANAIVTEAEGKT